MVITNAGNKIDDEASLLVIQSVELTSSDDDDYFVINGYMDGKEVTLESVVTSDIDITDAADEDIADEDCEALSGGAIAEVALDGAGKVDTVKVLWTAEDAVYGTTLKDGDVENEAAYVFGAIASDKVSGTGKTIDLAEAYNVEPFVNIATAGAGMKGNIYLVEQGARKNTVTVDTSIADYVGSIDENTESGDTVYVAFAKLYDGDTVDVLVYEVEKG